MQNEKIISEIIDNSFEKIHKSILKIIEEEYAPKSTSKNGKYYTIFHADLVRAGMTVKYVTFVNKIQGFPEKFTLKEYSIICAVLGYGLQFNCRDCQFSIAEL